jgi:aromatic ring-opening dioxygenase catalytic subunit (LigB family)
VGRVVYAAAMSHVLYPPYYEKNVGPHSRRMVEELIAVVGEMGRELAARRPDALVVVADDHLNVFSFDAVPAMCVRIGRSVSRMAQQGAIEFDRALDGLAERYPLHEDLANRILEDGLEAGFDFAASWSAPLDHAFLSPLSVLHADRPMTPLVPFWVNCFVAPLPSARRCFAAGQHIARVVASGPWNVGIIATGGLSHFPELSLARVGESDSEFDRRVLDWMERGDHASLTALTTKELHATGSHELLNWMVLLGVVAPARARVRFFGEMGRIDLAAVEWPIRYPQGGHK